jgi:hypothetical protein
MINGRRMMGRYKDVRGILWFRKKIINRSRVNPISKL